VDAVVVQADHDEYRSLGPADIQGASVVLDGRGIVDERAFVAGPVLVRLGRPPGDVTP
jgi:UDP-N-acetyl-D-mannosaminuronate dehydrogenase